MDTAKNHDTAIAIIGMACKVPGAQDERHFWHNLVENTATPDQLAQAVLSERSHGDSASRNHEIADTRF